MGHLRSSAHLHLRCLTQAAGLCGLVPLVLLPISVAGLRLGQSSSAASTALLGLPLTEDQQIEAGELLELVPESQEVLQSCGLVALDFEGEQPVGDLSEEEYEESADGTGFDGLSARAEDEACPQLPQEEAAAAVLFLGSLVRDGALTREEFLSQVEGCRITTCQLEELERLVQMSQFLRREETCTGSSDDDAGLDDCLQQEQAEERVILSRMTPPSTQMLERREAEWGQGQYCECEFDIIQRDDLMSIVSEGRIAPGPVMMREAAFEYCSRLGSNIGQPLSVFFLAGCAPEARGYCCLRQETWEDVDRTRERKLDKITKNVLQTMQMVEDVLSASKALETEVTGATQLAHINMEHKVLLYKLFVVFYHHARLFLARHRFCTLHPDDLLACQDPMLAASVLGVAHAEIMKTKSLLSGLVTCMHHGARPLSEELAVGRTPLEKIMGVAGNVIWRSIHYIGTGQLTQRAHKLARSLVRTAWNYHFEITVMGLMAYGAQPLMEALTATGVTTGTATSISLVFEQMIRSVFIHVACPVISSPLLMSMLIRWTMHKIVLSEFFIDNVLAPLWVGGDVVMGPLRFGGKLLALPFDVAKKMLRAIREKLDLEVDTQSATLAVKKTWLEKAREFHATPVAALLYAGLSSWLGGIWRTLMTTVCTVSKIAVTALNGAEAVVETTGVAVSSFWMTLSAMTSNFFKWAIGDTSSEHVDKMLEVNMEAVENTKLIAPKALTVMHTFAAKANLLSSVAAHGALDTMLTGLSYFTESAAVTYILARLFAWTWSTFYDPNPQAPAVHEHSLHMATTVDFNEESCHGKKHGAQCLLLQRPGLESEEVAQGFCCRAVCQLEHEPCAEVTSEELLADREWDPAAVPVSHLRRQSKYLHGFVTMARSSFGPQCEVLGGASLLEVGGLAGAASGSPSLSAERAEQPVPATPREEAAIRAQEEREKGMPVLLSSPST